MTVSVRRGCLVVVGVLVCTARAPRAQTPAERVAAIESALAAAEVERAIMLGREALADLPPETPAVVRSRVHLLVGIASLSLRMVDSAIRYLSPVIAADPLAELDPEQFNPDVRATFEEARRVTPTVALAIPADTVLSPERDAWPVDVVIGMPGDVTLEIAPRDSTSPVHRFTVPLVRRTRIPVGLLGPDSAPLPPGAYTLKASFHGGGDARALAAIELTVAKVAVDTTPDPLPPDPSRMLPEFRKGPVVLASLVAGIAVAGAAIAAPSVVPNKGLEVESDGRALIVGLSVAVGGGVGAVLGRRDVPIESNIASNRAVTTAWERYLAEVRAANQRTLRFAPLRVRRGTGP